MGHHQGGAFEVEQQLLKCPQGGDIEKKVREEGVDDEDEGLIIPLSIPLIAGPGAIVTAITIFFVGSVLSLCVPVTFCFICVFCVGFAFFIVIF